MGSLQQAPRRWGFALQTLKKRRVFPLKTGKTHGFPSCFVWQLLLRLLLRLADQFLASDLLAEVLPAWQTFKEQEPADIKLGVLDSIPSIASIIPNDAGDAGYPGDAKSTSSSFPIIFQSFPLFPSVSSHFPAVPFMSFHSLHFSNFCVFVRTEGGRDMIGNEMKGNEGKMKGAGKT